MYAIFEDDQEYQKAITAQSKFQFPLNSPKVKMVNDFPLPAEKSPPLDTKNAQKLIDHFEGVDDEDDMRLDIEHFH